MTSTSTLRRMPFGFGFATGPRRGPDGNSFASKDTPTSVETAVSFLSSEKQIQALLPPDFKLWGEPIATVYVKTMKNIEWLAGRGYNVCGVSFPAVYAGKKAPVHGHFLSVLWENKADPIITGREELGFAKIYCEIEEPRFLANSVICTTSWEGFSILELRVDGLQDTPLAGKSKLPPYSESQGTLHYKYIPRTGEWGKSDVEYAVLTPKETPNVSVTRRRYGKGSVSFAKATWEDLPTQYMIVNTLQKLEIKEVLEAKVTESTGGKDLSDQRILD